MPLLGYPKTIHVNHFCVYAYIHIGSIHAYTECIFVTFSLTTDWWSDHTTELRAL